MTLAIGISVGCAPNRNHEATVDSKTSTLTADQCDYFQVGGKTRICHATGSAKNPYVILDVSGAACISAHAAHPADFVAVGTSSCDGKGCLPQGAPADPALACCEGLAPKNGVCQPTDPCLGVTCIASDQCRVSACDSVTGRCIETAKVDAFPCDDGNACTTGDACSDGICSGVLVTCTGDACNAPGICDPASGLCIDTPLPNGTPCGTGGLCRGDGSCVECLTNTDCTGADKPQCTDNICVPCSGPSGEVACQQHEGQHCEEASTLPALHGRCVPCRGERSPAATDCPAQRPLCNPASGTCGLCDTDGTSQCLKFSAVAVCDNPASGGTGACIGCVTDADCQDPGSPHCISRVCVGCDSTTNTHGDESCARFPDRPACQPNDGTTGSPGSCQPCSATDATICVSAGLACDIGSGSCLAAP